MGSGSAAAEALGETPGYGSVSAGGWEIGGRGAALALPPGYYAAYVLDPDGNNTEVVNHH
jgi:hypothetical protein